jgi:hypothetical protein
MTLLPSLPYKLYSNVRALLQKDTSDDVTPDVTRASEIRLHATQKGETFPCTGLSSAVTMQIALKNYVTSAVTLS